MTVLRNWVSVKKLPPEGLAVLVFIKDGDTFNIITAHQIARVWWWFEYPLTIASKVKGQDNITHWMSLPPHPKIVPPKLILISEGKKDGKQ